MVNKLDHPLVGRLNLDLLHLEIVEDPQLTVVLQTPYSDADRQKILRLVDRRLGARPA